MKHKICTKKLTLHSTKYAAFVTLKCFPHIPHSHKPLSSPCLTSNTLEFNTFCALKTLRNYAD